MFTTPRQNMCRDGICCCHYHYHLSIKARISFHERNERQARRGQQVQVRRNTQQDVLDCQLWPQISHRSGITPLCNVMLCSSYQEVKSVSLNCPVTYLKQFSVGRSCNLFEPIQCGRGDIVQSGSIQLSLLLSWNPAASGEDPSQPTGECMWGRTETPQPKAPGNCPLGLPVPT